MIEQVVQDYLSQALNIPVKLEKPKTPKPSSTPLKYVVVEKTGSGIENHLKTSMFAVQSYAESLYEAAKLNHEVINAMMDIITVDEITKVTLNSDYNFTDTTTKQPRYQAVFELVHYERT